MSFTREKNRGFWESFVCVLSGEWVLSYYPNGGTAVFLRTTFVTTLVFGTTFLLRARLAPGATAALDWDGFRLTLEETMPWAGAIFAGVYVAFYTRFSTQWGYLANLYNQIMAMACTLDSSDEDAMGPMRKWKAGFIEDAYELHLYKKEMFAAVVCSLLSCADIRQCFVDTVADSSKKLTDMEQYFAKAFGITIKAAAALPTPAPVNVRRVLSNRVARAKALQASRHE